MAELHVIKKLRNEPDILDVNDSDLSAYTGTEVSENAVRIAKELSVNNLKFSVLGGGHLSFQEDGTLKVDVSKTVDASIRSSISTSLLIITAGYCYGIIPVGSGFSRGVMPMVYDADGNTMVVRYKVDYLMIQGRQHAIVTFDSAYATAVNNPDIENPLDLSTFTVSVLYLGE